MLGAIWNILLNVYAILGTVPFLVFPIIGLFAYAIGKDKKAALRIAMDVTTFFLIGSVSALYDQVIGTEIKGFWIILFLLLLLTGILGNAQNRIHGKLNPEKLLRAVWRLGFLMLVVFAVLLLLIGIVQQLITT